MLANHLNDGSVLRLKNAEKLNRREQTKHYFRKIICQHSASPRCVADESDIFEYFWLSFYGNSAPVTCPNTVLEPKKKK